MGAQAIAEKTGALKAAVDSVRAEKHACADPGERDALEDRQQQLEGEDRKALAAPFVAGAALVVITLVSFGSVTGGKPGQVYTPPSFKDGRIEPGHIE